MSRITSKNVEIEPTSCGYTVLSTDIERFVRTIIEEKKLDAFEGVRVGVTQEPRKEPVFEVAVLFKANSKDINVARHSVNSPIIERIPNETVSPSKLLKDTLISYVKDDFIPITFIPDRFSPSYAVILDLRKVLAFMFDADRISTEVIIVHFKEERNATTFEVFKQYIPKQKEENGDYLSEKAKRAFKRY